ncbi:hypothetical protein QUA30_11295 [Microcoleus sp. Pol14C2]
MSARTNLDGQAGSLSIFNLDLIFPRSQTQELRQKHKLPPSMEKLWILG